MTKRDARALVALIRWQIATGAVSLVAAEWLRDARDGAYRVTVWPDARNLAQSVTLESLADWADYRDHLQEQTQATKAQG